MSDTATGRDASTGATPDATPDDSSSHVDDQSGESLGEQARRAIANLRRENRATIDGLKAERDAALARVAEYEDAQSTEVDKLRSQLGRSDKRIAELESTLAERDTAIAQRDHAEAQRAAAAKYHIPDYLADRLVGSTPDELDADAKAMSDRLTSGRTSDLGQGARPGMTQSGMSERIRRGARR